MEDDEEQFTTDAVPVNEEYEEYGMISYFNLKISIIELQLKYDFFIEFVMFLHSTFLLFYTLQKLQLLMRFKSNQIIP